MRNHPNPHLIRHQGIWHSCYGNSSRGSKYRCQMVIAEGKTPLLAYTRYWETLDDVDKRQKAITAAARGGKFNMNIIMAAWQRLRGKSG